MKNPFVIGGTIYLRTIEESDLTSTYREWFNDADVCRFNSNHRFPNYDEDMHAFYERVIKPHHDIVLAIADKETDEHIGNISLVDIDTINRWGDIQILIGEKSHWGKGIGTEAVRLMLAHAFDELGLHRVRCGTSEDNIGMRKVAESLGFKEEGRSREAFWKGGVYRDIIHYGILSDEFKKA